MTRSIPADQGVWFARPDDIAFEDLLDRSLNRGPGFLMDDPENFIHWMVHGLMGGVSREPFGHMVHEIDTARLYRWQ
jgi:hypothetical protein